MCHVMLGQWHDFEKKLRVSELEAVVVVNIHHGPQ